MTASAGYDTLIAADRQKMAQLMIAPKLTSAGTAFFGGVQKGIMNVRNYGERLPIRGGNWGDGANAGLAGLFLDNRRSLVYYGLGLRPAFIL